MQGAGRALRRDLAAVAVLFLAVRLLAARSTELYDPEEQRVAAFALDIAAGRTLPLDAYQDPHQGGVLLNALMLVPLLRALGSVEAALRALWLGTSLGNLVAVYLCLRAFVSRHAANAAAALLALAPPSLVLWGVFDVSCYGLGVLVSTLVMLSAFRLAFSAGDPRAQAVQLGLLCGLGLYVEYTSLVMALACALFLAIAADRSRLDRRALLALAEAFVLGSGPWLGYNITHGFAGLYHPFHVRHPGQLTTLWREAGEDELFSIGGSGTARERAARAASKAASLAAEDLPALFGFQGAGPVGGEALGRLYYALFLASALLLLAAAARRRTVAGAPRERALFFLLYIALYLGLLALSRFEVTRDVGLRRHRYLLPVYQHIIVVVALALTEARSRPGWGRLHLAARLVALVCLLQLAVMPFQLPPEGEAGTISAEGFWWLSDRALAEGAFDADRCSMVGWCERFQAAAGPCYDAAARTAILRFGRGAFPLLGSCMGSPPRGPSLRLAEGLGYMGVRFIEGGPPPCDELPPAEQDACFGGVRRMLARHLVDDPGRAELECRSLPPQRDEECLSSLGRESLAFARGDYSSVTGGALHLTPWEALLGRAEAERPWMGWSQYT